LCSVATFPSRSRRRSRTSGLYSVLVIPCDVGRVRKLFFASPFDVRLSFSSIPLAVAPLSQVCAVLANDVECRPYPRELGGLSRDGPFCFVALRFQVSTLRAECRRFVFPFVQKWTLWMVNFFNMVGPPTTPPSFWVRPPTPFSFFQRAAQNE